MQMAGLAQGFSDWLSLTGDGGKGRALTDACMAAAASVATANGSVGFAERAKLDQVIDALQAKGMTTAAEASETFDGFADAIVGNSGLGRRAALAVAAEMLGEDAVVVMKVAEAMAESSGDDQVGDAVREIAAALGLEAPQPSG